MSGDGGASAEGGAGAARETTTRPAGGERRAAAADEAAAAPGTTTTAPQTTPPPPAAVELHLYDISRGLAASFGPMMLGVPLEALWHSSVVVREPGGSASAAEETFFGYGVQTAAAGTTPFGAPLRTLHLGTTELDADTRAVLLAELSARYTHAHYHLTERNCNHFASEWAELLCGVGAPGDVVGQAAALLATPMGRMVEPMLRQAMESVTGRATATGFDGGR
jgi:desumoylating isopeptidase 1